MAVINTFFGAFLGVWLVTGFSGILCEQWSVLAILLFCASVIYLLSRGIALPRTDRARHNHYIFAVALAFFLTFLLQVCVDSTLAVGDFLSLPQTWLFFLVVVTWIGVSELYKWATSRESGEK